MGGNTKAPHDHRDALCKGEYRKMKTVSKGEYPACADVDKRAEISCVW